MTMLTGIELGDLIALSKLTNPESSEEERKAISLIARCVEAFDYLRNAAWETSEAHEKRVDDLLEANQKLLNELSKLRNPVTPVPVAPADGPLPDGIFAKPYLPNVPVKTRKPRGPNKPKVLPVASLDTVE